MFKWLFKDKFDFLKDLIKVLKSGININVNITGTLNVEERRNIVAEEAERRTQSIFEVSTKRDRENEAEAKIIGEQLLPNLSKLQIPTVKFGEEKDTG